ncbi:MAG: hypothetical protein MI747_06135 [Desulfobacterales bacterium]|nr:hypothetical protein [Desulfobacterales bacterium]
MEKNNDVGRAGQAKVGLWFLAILAWLAVAAPVRADVLFTHEIQSYDYMLGKTDARMHVGYTQGVKYTDKETRYTSGLLKRFFGKVKTGRSTSEFNLKTGRVAEVDWENEYVYAYPLARISDPDWHRKQTPFAREREEFVKDRYTVSEPVISFEFGEEPEQVNGYAAQRVDIQLELSTLDKKKNAQSITHITQSLWLSREVAGCEFHDQFNRELASRTGVDRHRLGLLGDLLSHFPRELSAIEGDLARISGYAVKSRFAMEGSYVRHFADQPSKTTTKLLKEETMELASASETPALDLALFQAPASFALKMVE